MQKKILYESFVIDIEEEEVTHYGFVFAYDDEDAKLKALAEAIKGGDMQEDMDRYYVHVRLICALPQRG